MDIKISVIMPSLNVVDYIREAVESVMKQTLGELEILCIDAGSTDGTREIIEELATKDRRIHIIDSDVRSYGYQINKGVELAKGKYVAVVETDDYIADDMYEKLYFAAEENCADYAKANYHSFINQGNGERFFLNCRIFGDIASYGKVINPREFSDIIICDWFIWSGIYKRQFLVERNIKLNESKGAAYQDIGFLHKVNVNAERAFYIDEYGYNYCIDRENSSTNSGKALNFAYDEFSNLLNEYEAKGCADSYELYPLFVRMSKVFIGCYHNILINNLAKDDAVEEKYKWFRTKLGQAVEEGIISSFNMDKHMWKTLSSVLASVDGYEIYLKERERDLVSHIGNPGDNQVVIFCCGNYGFNTYKYLVKRGYNIVAFTDNNSSVWGKSLCDVPIKSPKEILKDFLDVRYVIANEKYYDEIKQQLLNEGVDKECVHIFNM